jgi:hypothetical protein
MWMSFIARASHRARNLGAFVQRKAEKALPSRSFA